MISVQLLSSYLLIVYKINQVIYYKQIYHITDNIMWE